MSTKRGCSLGDVGCGVQRSVELPVRVIKSRSVPIDVCRHATDRAIIHYFSVGFLHHV